MAAGEPPEATEQRRKSIAYHRSIDRLRAELTIIKLKVGSLALAVEDVREALSRICVEATDDDA